ncbi:MAG TPA: hypothetical protein VKZ61_01455 [Thermomicrobiales bacterium]|nr:hypothetical protein [Thermomicrobiales bacterium]
MTLPAPTAVAIAVSGGSPIDVREWITVDLPGPPTVHRRGFAVMTEALNGSGREQELARQVRALILQELRAHPRQPADAALARAFAIANTFVFEEGRFRGGVGQEYFVGATAVVFEDHKATIAHVPPGQLILAQDGVVYSVPEIDSRLPRWAEAPDDAPTPEPFGFASWTAPLMVQTEIMSGDTIVLCNSAVATALAEEGTDLGEDRVAIRQFHARDPDRVLDIIRDVIVERDEAYATVAVIGFPPNPTGAEIETFADIGRNAREQWRHAKAAMRSVLPAPALPARRRGAEPEAEDDSQEPAPVGRSRITFQERIARFTEGPPLDEKNLWRQPSEMRQFGAPGAHGVSRYRTMSLGGGESTWRHALPRVPFVRSPIFIAFCLLLVMALATVGWMERDRFLPSEEDYLATLAEVDQRLLTAEKLEDLALIEDELQDAEEGLDRARRAGAPDGLIGPRENQITLIRDEAYNVIRLDDVTRIGGLPEDLQHSGTAAFNTPGGIFLANGDLYRLRPETAEMQLMLQQGQEIEGATVGHLFGVAWDGQYLVTTDGRHLFFAGSTDGAIWQAMEMEEINQQGPWPEGPIAAFGEGMYLLVDDYRNIYMFPMDENEQTTASRDWVLTGDRVNFDMAVDLTIDGNIYVLLSNGQVLTMTRGAEVNRFDVPDIDLDTEEPLAIVGGPMTGYIYVAVVDKDGHGRVIAMDREGGHVSQLALPAGFSTGDVDVLPPFDDLQDIAVDENSGTLYLINGDAVWTARYSLPPLPSPEGTPVATPGAAE